MDSAVYADDLGVVDTRIADGELSRRGMGTAKKVAVGAGALVAGAGTFIGGCKLAGKIDSVKNNWNTVSNNITKYNNNYLNSLEAQGVPLDAKGIPDITKATENQIKTATDAAKASIGGVDCPKESIFQKAAGVTIFGKEGIFGKGILGKGNIVGEKLSNHWTKVANSLKDGKGMESEFLNKVFGKMSNYPMLAAAGLAGAGFFIYKGIKKLINKRKGVDEPSFGR